MPEIRKFLDVWIVDSNLVYREVPYTVVCDWIQQGRLLEEDRARPSGTGEWFPLSGMPAFTPYFPKAEPLRPDDQAEALEPVQIDFVWKRPQSDEDEDVDMIPLIDVSLVLLIFFMMTATVASAQFYVRNVPKAVEATELSNDPQSFWIGIQKLADNSIVYALGEGDSLPAEADRNWTESQVVQQLTSRLRHPVPVHIKAGADVPYGVVKRITGALSVPKARGQITKINADVKGGSEPQ
jgi:biopolymer transport protein ExbD